MIDAQVGLRDVGKQFWEGGNRYTGGSTLFDTSSDASQLRAIGNETVVPDPDKLIVGNRELDWESIPATEQQGFVNLWARTLPPERVKAVKDPALRSLIQQAQQP
jgi:hypothetical protein